MCHFPTDLLNIIVDYEKGSPLDVFSYQRYGVEFQYTTEASTKQASINDASTHSSSIGDVSTNNRLADSKLIQLFHQLRLRGECPFCISWSVDSFCETIQMKHNGEPWGNNLSKMRKIVQSKISDSHIDVFRIFALGKFFENEQGLHEKLDVLAREESCFFSNIFSKFLKKNKREFFSEPLDYLAKYVDDVTLSQFVKKACEANNKYALKFLVTNSAPVETFVNRDKTTILMSVVQNYNMPLVKILVENKANVNAIDNQSRSVLFYALDKNEDRAVIQTLKIVELLVKHGADPRNASSFDINKFCLPTDSSNKLIQWVQQSNSAKINHYIKEAMRHSNFAGLKLLFDKGISLDQHDTPHGNTNLMIAAKDRNYSLMEFFIDLGAEVNAKNNAGDNALFLTISYSFSFMLSRNTPPTFEQLKHLCKVVKILLKKGACAGQARLLNSETARGPKKTALEFFLFNYPQYFRPFEANELEKTEIVKEILVLLCKHTENMHLYRNICGLYDIRDPEICNIIKKYTQKSNSHICLVQ